MIVDDLHVDLAIRRDRAKGEIRRQRRNGMVLLDAETAETGDGEGAEVLGALVAREVEGVPEDEAAQEAGTRGVRLIAIGLGDENEGTRIPITGPDGGQVFLKYNGEEVWSKLDADTLRKMVNTTPGGRYLNVSTGAIDLGDVYVKLIANETQREFESRTIERFEEKFQIFLGMAFFLLCIEMFIRDRRPGEGVMK